MPAQYWHENSIFFRAGSKPPVLHSEANSITRSGR